MREGPTRQRNWLETCIIFFLWGTDGLERGKSLPRFSLNALFLMITLLCVWLVQVVVLPAGSREYKIVGVMNLVIVCIAACFYKRSKRRTLWRAATAALLGTLVAALINQWTRISHY